MPTHSNTTPERLEAWESLDRGSTAAPEPVYKQEHEALQAASGEHVLVPLSLAAINVADGSIISTR
jgi:hypothetical protein